MHLKEKLRYTTAHIFEKGKAGPFAILICAFDHHYQIKSLAEDKDGKDGRINYRYKGYEICSCHS